MKHIHNLGRLAFAMAMVLFGLQYFVFKMYIAPIVPLSGTGQLFWVYLFGAALIFAGTSIGLKFRIRIISSLLAVAFLILILLLHIPVILSNCYDGREYTRVFELLALSGGALIIAQSQPFELKNGSKHHNLFNLFLKSGRFLFALSLLIFGIQHFIYGQYVAAVIPAWIPGHLFWAYFVGAAFILASISIIFEIETRLVTILLAIMFLIWVLILHLPRCFVDFHNEAEWSSAFVALAMGGISFVLAGFSPKHRIISKVYSIK
jgi:uncharacterized membrane protein